VKRVAAEDQIGRIPAKIFGFVRFRTSTRSMSMQSKIRRRVLAPYSDPDGNRRTGPKRFRGNFSRNAPVKPLDRYHSPVLVNARKYRPPDTKSEKLLAKLILASTNAGDLVFDPFLGSGTSSVVAKKAETPIPWDEIDRDYCAARCKRLQIAENDNRVQGLTDGVFWGRTR